LQLTQIIVSKGAEYQEYKETGVIKVEKYSLETLVNCFSGGFKKVVKFPWLILLVFVFSALVTYNEYISYLQFTTVGSSIQVVLPWSFPDLDIFFSFPTDPYVNLFFNPSLSLIDALITLLWVGIALVVIRSLLAAGYLGDIYSKLFTDKKYGFVSSLIKYLPRIIVFELFFFALRYVLLVLIVASKILIGFYMYQYVMMFWVLNIVVTYLFILVPYIIVADNEKILTAIKKSITYMGSSETIAYLIIFGIITAITSFAVSVLLPIP